MTDEIDTSYPERIWARVEPDWHEGITGENFVGGMFDAGHFRDGVPYVREDIYEAERQRAEKAEAALRVAVGAVVECTCHPAYSERGLQDPECPAGLFGDIVREGLGLPPLCQYNRAALRQDEGGE